MALRPGLDTKLSLSCLRLTLPGNWELLDSKKSWKDFESGQATAVRTIRHGGKKYWVTACMIEVNSLAKLVAFGLLADAKREYFVHFNLYSSDPRLGRPTIQKTLGGVGVITRISSVLS